MTEIAKRHREWNAETDPEVLESEVMGCLEETKERLDVKVEGNVIYEEVEPEHLVEDLLAEFLAKQFPEHHVVLESSRGTFVSGEGVAGVVRTETGMNELVTELKVKN